MATFFNDFGKKITSVGQETVKRTKEIAEIGKIGSKIKDEEKKLEGLYTKLGKKYFSLYSKNQVEEIQDICTAISEAQSNIEAMKKALQVLKGVKVCKNCGAEQENDTTFCSKCGAKLVDEVEAVIVDDTLDSDTNSTEQEDKPEE